jgi:hypothetical protein
VNWLTTTGRAQRVKYSPAADKLYSQTFIFSQQSRENSILIQTKQPWRDIISTLYASNQHNYSTVI